MANDIGYTLHLSEKELKVVWTALHAMLNDFGHEEADVLRLIREVLGKLPDEHSIRAINLSDGH